VTAGTVPALPVRATSWWYVGQIPVGNAAAVALGDADADADDELGVTADDAAALAETGADDDSTAAADDAAADEAGPDEAGPDEAGPDAAGAACLLDVHAASTRLPPTMAVSTRRCPIASSVPTSG